MATWQDYMEERIKGRERTMPWFLHDKLKCYRFCEEHGIPTATVLREFERPEDINLSGLQGEFVLKPTLQSSMKGVMVLTPVGSGYYDDLRGRKLSLAEIVVEQTRLFDQTKAAGKKIIVEEKITDIAGLDVPRDFKAYAFNGKVALILEIDRNSGSSVVSWYGESFEPITDGRVAYTEKYRGHTVGQSPHNAHEILEIARKASSAVDTPFARIDMYSTPHGVIVGEITLVPGGLYYGNQYFLSEEQQELMGHYWEEALARLGRSDEIIRTPLTEDEPQTTNQ